MTRYGINIHENPSMYDWIGYGQGLVTCKQIMTWAFCSLDACRLFIRSSSSSGVADNTLVTSIMLELSEQVHTSHWIVITNVKCNTSNDYSQFFCLCIFGIVPHLSDILCPEEYKSRFSFKMDDSRPCIYLLRKAMASPWWPMSVSASCSALWLLSASSVSSTARPAPISTRQRQTLRCAVF